MDGFDNNKTNLEKLDAAGLADVAIAPGDAGKLRTGSQGASIQASELDKALNNALAPDERAASVASDADHDHAPPIAGFEVHIDITKVANARGLDAKNLVQDSSFRDNLGAKGDLLDAKGGVNTVIGSGDSDIIRGKGLGLNTITTGTGKDTVILGRETTNRVLDFDPTNDRFVLSGINPKNIIIAQGTNPGKGGLQQPLDSVNNALVIDKREGHILASLPFVKASDLSDSNFVRDSIAAEKSLNGIGKELGFKTQRGDGKLTGTQGHDRLLGGEGDDFLYVGNDGFKFNTASASSGETEFPFKNDSPGSTEIKLELKDGVLRTTGSYKDFDAAPLFSQGETVIDPKATILNGSDPVSLINNFLKVPNDVEGNPLSGTHLHFSPSGDNRGNFADATVLRYFTNNVIDPKSGTITGEFELKPEEQAALLAGDLYLNIHSNIDLDGDGKAGFPTGENRINFNRDVVQFV